MTEGKNILAAIWNDLKTFALGFCFCLSFFVGKIPSPGPVPVPPPPAPGPGPSPVEVDVPVVVLPDTDEDVPAPVVTPTPQSPPARMVRPKSNPWK